MLKYDIELFYSQGSDLFIEYIFILKDLIKKANCWGKT